MTKSRHEHGFSAPERQVEEYLRELHEVYGFGEQLHSYERVMPDGLEAPEALRWLGEQVAHARYEGKHIALVAGGFDVPHDNHEWYIRDCRAQVAKRILQTRGRLVTPESILDEMRRDQIALIVSIDSDEAINQRKGGKTDKGGIPRPVYPWAARAHRIAGYSYEDPITCEVRHTADIVSKECSVNYAGTPMERAATVAKYLKSIDLLDEYIVFDEHPQDEVNARDLGFDPIILPMAVVYSRDPRDNSEYKSSGIIKKIRGEG